MRKLLLFPLLLVCACCNSQAITIKDLTTILAKKHWEDVNSYLTNKGWRYNSSSEGSESTYEAIIWSYGNTDHMNKAGGWFHLYSDEGIPEKASIQFVSTSSFNSFKSGLASYGLKRDSSKIDEKGLVTYYSNKSYLGELITTISEDDFESRTTYVFILEKNYRPEFIAEVQRILRNQINIDTTAAYVDEADEEIPMGFTGKRRLRESDGTYCDVVYKDGALNGLSKCFDAEGKITGEFNYVNGVEQGSYKLYENGKLVETGSYTGGKRNGPFRQYENGTVSAKGTYIDEVLEGPCTEYYYNPTSMILLYRDTGMYTQNEKYGTWQRYNFKGVLLEEVEFMNGQKHGISKVYFPAEGVESESSYTAGIRYSEKFVYSKSGQKYTGKLFRRAGNQIHEEIEVVEGLRNGTTKIFDEKGKLVETINYRQGVAE